MSCWKIIQSRVPSDIGFYGMTDEISPDSCKTAGTSSRLACLGSVPGLLLGLSNIHPQLDK